MKHFFQTWRRFSAGLLVFLLASAAIPSQAHVGTQNIVFEGLAGPYPLRVMIKPPVVVPGLAQVTIRRLSDEVTGVSVLPMRWDVGRKGAPPPEDAVPVKGDDTLFTAQLWLMDSGAYSVLVNAKGSRGEHALIVPVNSVATQRLGLPKWFGAMLGVLGLLLVGLLATIAGSAVRESSLPAGMLPDRRRKVRGVVASLVFGLILAGGLVFGRAWWTSEENRYLNRVLYKPEPLEVRNVSGRLLLELDPAGEGQRDRTPLIPDHGKLMHLFMVRSGTMDAVAHLHPVRIEGGKKFACALPPLPEGKYELFADITQESGFAQTLVGTVVIPPEDASARYVATDPDDAFRAVALGDPLGIGLSQGRRLRRIDSVAIRVDQPAALRFQVVDAEGRAVELEPYLGMFGHAFILKEDSTVFSHLHPQGNVSMGAGLAFTRRELGDQAAHKLMEEVCSPLGADHVLTFPYAFPQAGIYRMWVQVRVAGQVETAAFQIKVE
jgi:hypothetical protein